jgi:hypothetical protein
VLIASFATDWGPTIAGAVIGTVGVLGGLGTALLTIHAQERARREDHENERSRRLDDEILAAAGALSAALTGLSLRLHSIRTDTAREDLAAIQQLLPEAQGHLGRYSVLLGNRHLSVLAAGSALNSLRYAFGWAGEVQTVKTTGKPTTDARSELERYLADAGRSLAEFNSSARQALRISQPRANPSGDV